MSITMHHVSRNLPAEMRLRGACLRNDFEEAKVCVEEDLSSVFTTYDDGWTVLMVACEKNHYRIAEVHQ